MGKETLHKQVKGNLDHALSGETVQYQSWFEFAGIGRLFMDVIYHPFKDSQGEISGVVVSVHNITKRKQAEEELRQYEYIVSSASDMLALIDHNYVYLAANSAYLKTIG